MYADGSIAPTPELGEVRNVAPKTRSERLSQLYKEDLEKSRLRARREGYYRHEEAGITQPEGSLGSISDADRFVTDVASVNKNERDAAIARKEQIYYSKRLGNADREEKRWRTIEMEDDLDRQRWDEMREHGTFSRSNKTSVPYNPISLKYDDSNDGDRLRFSDDTLRYRSALRADHLQRRMNGAGYNPITGAPMERIKVPDPPSMPSFMQQEPSGGH